MTTSLLTISDQQRARLATQDAQASVRILHVINGEHYAGAERVQDLLALNLPRFDFDVEFAAVKPVAFDESRRSTSPLHHVSMPSRFDLRAAWRLAALVQRRSCALIHSHTPRTALVGGLASKITGVPMVHHIHGQTSSEVSRHLFGKFSAAVESWSIRHAARTIAVSASSYQYALRQGFDPDHLSLVPNGVPADPSAASRTAPVADWTIGSIALFRPRKGVETLMEAIARLRNHQLPVTLRLIGGFETAAYESHLRQLADRLQLSSAVTWVGFSSDVQAELAKVDVMVLPSLLPEGLPMAVIEAMAGGVPVVASRVDGIVDVIDGEQDGLLFEPGNSDSLANELARLISGEVDYASLRDNAIRRHAESYSDHGMAASVARIYRDVLASTANTQRFVDQ